MPWPTSQVLYLQREHSVTSNSFMKTSQWRHNERDRVASQITSLTIVYSTVYSGVDQRKHQRSALLAFVRRIHPSVTGEFPAQKASNAENISIWWRHHIYDLANLTNVSESIILQSVRLSFLHSFKLQFYSIYLNVKEEPRKPLWNKKAHDL